MLLPKTLLLIKVTETIKYIYYKNKTYKIWPVFFNKYVKKTHKQ